MEKWKHVIVEFVPAATVVGSMISLKSAKRFKLVRTQIDEITDTKAAEINRQKKQFAIQQYPLRLIRPVGFADQQAPSAPLWSLESIGALGSPYTGKGSNVAILDTGIEASHPAFAHLKDLIVQDFSGEGSNDTDGHGTHCAGTIFGDDVQGVRVGVAPNVARALVAKVIGADGANTKSVIDAINWALSEGANIISMSLGIDFAGYQCELQRQGLPPDIATSRALEGYLQNARLFGSLADAALQQAKNQNDVLVIIAASGNESRRDVNEHYTVTVAPPAVGEGIISVGALQRDGHSLVVAPFSNSGPLVSAPGCDVVSAALGGGLASMSGTSMAAPHVAGVAALWIERLRSEQRLNAATFPTFLIGQASHIKGHAADIGAGLIQAPR